MENAHYFLHVTDTHLCFDAEAPDICCTEQALRSLYQTAFAWDHRPAFVLITGDLVHEGTSADYARAKTLLQELDERVKLHEPLCFHDYNHLQMNAFAVISDSGTLPEESSFFTSVGHPFPAVCIRTSTERPEALDKGCFVLAGIRAGGVEQAVETAVAMNANGDYGIPVPYYTEDVSTKVVKIIQSYTGVVNKMVWRKN